MITAMDRHHLIHVAHHLRRARECADGLSTQGRAQLALECVMQKVEPPCWEAVRCLADAARNVSRMEVRQ